jgi:anti-sigma regulatory factor (Ser/Thr protein kinase)
VSVETDIATDPRDHVVRFYDSDQELIETVGTYLADAVSSGEVAIVVATPDHSLAFVSAMAAAGLDPARAVEDGTLITLDAAETLACFLVDGHLDPERFDAVIGGLVRDASAGGRPVRAYGEMVALLWDAGHVTTAIELEGLWNHLRRDLPFSLLCGYRASSVAGDEHADAFHQVCHLHSEVVGAESTEEARAFAGEPRSARLARLFVAETLRRWDLHDMVDDAEAIVAELAANAVFHARSGFVVALSSDKGVVRLSVRDGSPVRPAVRAYLPAATSGRGLALVAAIAARWGDRCDGDGKVVWAELVSRGAG